MEKIEGIPEGYRLVAIRPPRKGDEYVNSNGRAVSAQENFVTVYPIIEKIEPQYRPFRNADEFRPFRDKWIDDLRGNFLRVCGCDDDCVWFSAWNAEQIVWTFDELIKECSFEDGTPCGLPVIEGE